MATVTELVAAWQGAGLFDPRRPDVHEAGGARNNVLASSPTGQRFVPHAVRLHVCGCRESWGVSLLGFNGGIPRQ